MEMTRMDQRQFDHRGLYEVHSHGPYETYWGRVEEFINPERKPDQRPKHKTTAIRLSQGSIALPAGETLIRNLWQAMSSDLWRQPKSKSTDNWMWRKKAKSASERGKEVALERQIVELGSGRWCCQMSTASGLLGARKGKRRAIDLVHRNGEGHYSFVELKCKDSNPVYAAFQILSYGLAYLHARRVATVSQAAMPEVMTADFIDLVVVGPREWYDDPRYKSDGGRSWLGSLQTAIEAGLAALAEEASS
jgi:hypothetical protein